MNKIAVPYKIPNWYRVRYANQQPSLVGNSKEGSETGGSLNSKEYGDNTRSEKEIFQDMPDTQKGEDTVRTTMSFPKLLSAVEISATAQ